MIEVRAPAVNTWSESEVVPWLKARMPGFPRAMSIRGFSVQAEFKTDSANPEPTQAPVSMQGQDHGWQGLQLMSDEWVISFQRDRFFCSRLGSYPGWEPFSVEAIRLWEIHREIAGVAKIERLGLRYVNRIEVPVDGLDFSRYFADLPVLDVGLPVSAFLHTYTFVQPPGQYQVNVTRTFQPRADDRLALLLDIDAFMVEAIPSHRQGVEESLRALRSLKNRVFFASLTKEAIERCK